MFIDDLPVNVRRGRLEPGQNFGAIVNAVACGDLRINAALHDPGMVVPRHEHASPYVCVVMAGCLEVRARDTFDCPAGSVIAYPSGHAHANRFSDHPGRCINVHFGSTWTEERPIGEWLADCRSIRIDTHARSFVRLGMEMQAGDSAAPLAAASAAIELFADVMRIRVPASQPKWVASVVDIVEADLASAPALGELAREVGAHPAHLARVFRRACGESIGAYVRRRRVEEADRALATTNRSLAEIAMAAGFCDQAHFTRVYRKYFGASPGARRRTRNARSNNATPVQDDPPAED